MLGELINLLHKPLRRKQIFSKLLSPYRAVNIVFVIKTSQLILRMEKIAVGSEIHTKHINTLCDQNIELSTITRYAA